MCNYQYFCAKVLDHSWKIENEILIDRLDHYKQVMGYKEVSPEERKAQREAERLKKKQRESRTPSEEAKRLEAYQKHEAEIKRVKEEARGGKITHNQTKGQGFQIF